METQKPISNAKAAAMCKKLIYAAIRKGVVMRPGRYIDSNWANGRTIHMACALGSIEHALASGKKISKDTYFCNTENLARKVNHGITAQQLDILEAGFEGQHLWRRNPLHRLGAYFRKRALKILKAKYPTRIRDSYTNGSLCESRTV